jgi:steroid delta-isomerase-like uncharacterized protein
VQRADVQRWLDAWNSRDMARIAALFTPDAVVHQPQNSQPMSVETAMAFFEMVFRAFPDVHFEPVGASIGNGEAASWERVIGTMLGPMSEPATGRTWPPTGKRFEHVAAMRLVYAPDHRVREFWTIWDRAELLTQLGLSSTASASATAPITHADIDRWADAWNSHDIEKVAALFTPDVAIDQPENANPIGAAGIKPFFGMIFKAYPDFHVEVRQAIVDGMHAVSVEEVTGTWSGPFVDPKTGASTPGNGKKFDHPGAMVLEYAADHRIRRCSIYWDQLVVDHQLGIAPK